MRNKAIEEYEKQVDSTHAFELAKKEGLDVVLSDEHTVMIDIDGEEGLKVFHERRGLLDYWQCFEGLTYKRTASKTKGHYHIYLKTPKIKLSVMQRIFLQLYLGSDSRREFLCFHRILRKDPNPILFFERPENAGSLDKD